MILYSLLATAATMAQQVILADAASSGSSTLPFSSTFRQPPPPLLKPAFTASFNQHKWNENVSHITSGYWYSSPAAKKVRIDEAYDSNLASSLFDYNKLTSAGVYNVLWYLTPSIASAPQYFTGYVATPSFPLFAADLLVKSNAVYAGTTMDPDFGELQEWNILYDGTIPATLLIDDHGIAHGFDYWSPHERTFVITRLFNIATVEPPAKAFDFPHPTT